ncbi:MAG: hypothetical protein HY690_20935 [Chloroflexi bacterium]|nr:hypothetical protein [Chloroflexota bacterium]
MSKLWLKSCPRCRGDLYEEPAVGRHHFASYYITCLQCGHVLTDAQESLLTGRQSRAAPQPAHRVA